MAFQDVALWSILGGILLAVIVLVSYKIYDTKKRSAVLEDLPPNPIRVLNFWPEKADGHMEGYETKGIIYGKEGRMKVSFIPTDIEIKPKDKQESKRIYEKITMILNKGCRYEFIKGTGSKEKDIVIYLPPSPEYLDRFGNSPFINSLKEYLVNNLTENATIIAFRGGYDEAVKILKEANRGEATNQFRKLMKDHTENLVNDMSAVKTFMNNETTQRKSIEDKTKGGSE